MKRKVLLGVLLIIAAIYKVMVRFLLLWNDDSEFPLGETRSKNKNRSRHIRPASG